MFLPRADGKTKTHPNVDESASLYPEHCSGGLDPTLFALAAAPLHSHFDYFVHDNHAVVCENISQLSKSTLSNIQLRRTIY